MRLSLVSVLGRPYAKTVLTDSAQSLKSVKKKGVILKVTSFKCTLHFSEKRVR